MKFIALIRKCNILSTMLQHKASKESNFLKHHMSSKGTMSCDSTSKTRKVREGHKNTQTPCIILVHSSFVPPTIVIKVIMAVLQSNRNIMGYKQKESEFKRPLWSSYKLVPIFFLVKLTRHWGYLLNCSGFDNGRYLRLFDNVVYVFWDVGCFVKWIMGTGEWVNGRSGEWCTVLGIMRWKTDQI